MTDIQIFKNEQFGEVRTSDENGVTLFCAADVARGLGYKDTVNAVKQHCRGVVKRHLIDNLGRWQESKFVSEGNLYRLITHSKLPQAEKFESWIFDEVLPAIRKHGTYGEADYSNLSPQLQFLIQLEKKQNRLERRIDSMCETMQVRGTNWRRATHSLINRIASASGIEQRELYIVIYDELECRAGVDLDRRLTNLQDRLYDRGVSESRISRLNYIDVIAEDKKLIEIYVAIVKEMAVKYDA